MYLNWWLPFVWLYFCDKVYYNDALKRVVNLFCFIVNHHIFLFCFCFMIDLSIFHRSLLFTSLDSNDNHTPPELCVDVIFLELFSFRTHARVVVILNKEIHMIFYVSMIHLTPDER